jgi:hypothetical protein
LIVLGRRDFNSEAISELIQEAGGFALRFVSQEDLISILLLSSGEEVLRVEDIEIDASELVARHPAFAWLEDRFGWSTWADDLVPEWNEFVEDPSADHSAVVASGQGETGNDAGEEVESDDENNGGDEDEMEDYVEYDEQLEDEAVDDEDAAEASSIGDPDHAEQSAVWANRSQSEQDRFIADLPQFGMLKAFGYTVGAKASSDATRRARLRRALVEELPTRLGRSYIEECGPPNSLARLKKMADSIATFTRNAKRRRSTSMEESIRHWEMDLAWMKQEWYRPGMGFDWPGTYVG